MSLKSFNDDTFRAELSPRRVAPDGDGFKVVTPEEAAVLERKFIEQWQENIKAAGAKPKGMTVRDFHASVKPDKKAYVFVDVQARHFPKVWKLYELIDDATHSEGKRFVRVGQVEATDDEAADDAAIAALVPEVA